MGFFSDIFGIEAQDAITDGEIYEVRSALGVEEKEEQRMKRVASLLSTWHREYMGYDWKRKIPPTYGLEIHALNDNPKARKKAASNPLDDEQEVENPMDGYGTYIFIPEEMLRSSMSVMGNIYATPIEIPDQYDILKLLSLQYSDEQKHDKPPIALRTLKLANYDYYPIATWGKDTLADPMNELFSVFEMLRPGQFAGVSLTVRMANPTWREEGNKRIREIEDPTYIAHPTVFQRISGFFNETGSSMGTSVKRTAGYETQKVDKFESEEIKAIQEKQAESLFECSLRVYASSEEIADMLCSIILQRTSGRWNQFEVLNRRGDVGMLARREEGEGKTKFVLSASEIASIWHVPDDNNSTFAKLHKPLPQVTVPPDSVVIVPDNSPGDVKWLLKGVIKQQQQRQNTTARK